MAPTQSFALEAGSVYDYLYLWAESEPAGRHLFGRDDGVHTVSLKATGFSGHAEQDFPEIEATLLFDYARQKLTGHAKIQERSKGWQIHTTARLALSPNRSAVVLTAGAWTVQFDSALGSFDTGRLVGVSSNGTPVEMSYEAQVRTDVKVV